MSEPDLVYEYANDVNKKYIWLEEGMCQTVIYDGSHSSKLPFKICEDDGVWVAMWRECSKSGEWHIFDQDAEPIAQAVILEELTRILKEA